MAERAGRAASIWDITMEPKKLLSNTETDAAAQPHGVESTTPHVASGGNPTGALPSNTAPYTCTAGTKVLRAAVDSLYLSYPGSITEETSIRLETLKEYAQSQAADKPNLAQLSHGDHIFQVKDRGRHPFAFILQDPWFRIEVSSLAAASAPLAHCKLASEPLTFEGPAAVERELRQIVNVLGNTEGEANVSRADLCVDFVTDCDISKLTESDWVSRARNFSQHSVARQFSGWSIGQGGNLSCRLYNKLLEIEKSGKTYLFDIWRDQGWDGIQTVWRLEFQFRRDALRELEVKTFSQFMAKLGGLWRYSTERWLRLTIPNEADTTQSRWPLHSMWEALVLADWGIEQEVSRRSPPRSAGPSDHYLFFNGLSPLTSFMAREGIIDVDTGIREFFLRAKDYHFEQGVRITGVDFEEYVRSKVAQKARSYSSMKNNEVAGVSDPGNAAVARAYRKRRDG